VRLLLDTHVFIWLQSDPSRLGSRLAVAEDPANERLVSAASALEIAIKHAIGRLTLPEPPWRWVPDRITESAAAAVAVEHSHALAVADLPPIHGDPVDRLLVAQAIALDATLLTADPVVARYPVETLLA
jgi:PIN domain nuclease of toxin-antitoxin system